MDFSLLWFRDRTIRPGARPVPGASELDLDPYRHWRYPPGEPLNHAFAWARCRTLAPISDPAAHSSAAMIREALIATRTWAVVGCSPDPARDSHRIARLLQRRGFRVIPVNPHAGEILGERCYPSLLDVPAALGVEVVDIFRRADRAGGHVDEAISIGARAVWLQLGVIDEAAAARALHAGLLVVMDRCPAIELPRLAAA
jgi:predicted CoA-binding protein